MSSPGLSFLTQLMRMHCVLLIICPLIRLLSRLGVNFEANLMTTAILRDLCVKSICCNAISSQTRSKTVLVGVHAMPEH